MYQRQGLTFAMRVGIFQVPTPVGSASVSDLFASGVGGLAGFGLGAAIVSLWELVRERMKPAHKHG